MHQHRDLLTRRRWRDRTRKIDIIEWLDHALAEEGPPMWQGPNYLYHPDIGELKVLWEDADYYAKWLNNKIAIFLEEGTNKVVGCSISGLHLKENQINCF